MRTARLVHHTAPRAVPILNRIPEKPETQFRAFILRENLCCEVRKSDRLDKKRSHRFDTAARDLGVSGAEPTQQGNRKGGSVQDPHNGYESYDSILEFCPERKQKIPVDPALSHKYRGKLGLQGFFQDLQNNAPRISGDRDKR